VEIQAAVDALPVAGGRVVLTEGTFTLTKAIMPRATGCTIEGQGCGTLISTTQTRSRAAGPSEPPMEPPTEASWTAGSQTCVSRTLAQPQSPGICIDWPGYIPQRITIDHVEAENCSCG
jgi:hypothetical protein